MNDTILEFLFNLESGFILPEPIQILDPYNKEEVQAVCKAFYNKFYSIHSDRYLLIGINPGRFGGGITGIPFTDPIRLEKNCGISNPFEKKAEISSVFIYEMIHAFGGPEIFSNHFFITAMSPLGFTRKGKNLNYYDDKMLLEYSRPFILQSLTRQRSFPGIVNHTAFCIGEGKNFNILSTLNEEYGFFKEIIPLPHPRFIMQYRYRKKQEFIANYLEKLRSVL